MDSTPYLENSRRSGGRAVLEKHLELGHSSSLPLKAWNIPYMDYMVRSRSGHYSTGDQYKSNAGAVKEFDYLFLCAANVGRSQMAEGFYNHYTHGKNSLSAAVRYDVREKYKYRPHQGVIGVMLERGIDISDQSIKLFSPEMIKSCRRIVVLMEKEKCPLLLLVYFGGNGNVEFKPVDDPCLRDTAPDSSVIEILPAFRKTRDTIEEVVKQLL